MTGDSLCLNFFIIVHAGIEKALKNKNTYPNILRIRTHATNFTHWHPESSMTPTVTLRVPNAPVRLFQGIPCIFEAPSLPSYQGNMGNIEETFGIHLCGLDSEVDFLWLLQDGEGEAHAPTFC